GPEHHDEALHIAGYNRGYGGSHHSQGGGPQLAEDQDIVAYQVHQHRDYARLHGQHRLPGLPQGTGVYLHYGEGQHLPEHDFQVILAIVQGGGHVQALLPFVDELAYQRLPLGDEDGHGNGDDSGGNIYLASEAVGHA